MKFFIILLFFSCFFGYSRTLDVTFEEIKLLFVGIGNFEGLKHFSTVFMFTELAKTF